MLDSIKSMSIIKFNCYYCKSKVLDKFIRIDKFDLYKCKKCGLLITRINKVKLDVSRFNRNYYSRVYIKNYIQKASELNKRFLLRLHKIEQLKRGGRILDIGCGIGLFLETLTIYSNYKWNSFGIDINKRLIEVASNKIKGVRFIQGSLQTKKFSEKYFDCITCFDVLEHDIDILNTIKEIRRILKDDGLLVIQTPNYKSIMTGITRINWDWWSVPDHVIHFSPNTLKQILEDYGFEIKYNFTWEPVQDFVGNIKGTLKNNLPALLGVNRIISKLSVPFLYLLWIIVWGLEKKIPVGGLSLVYANKK